jgi:hypothetical protein
MITTKTYGLIPDPDTDPQLLVACKMGLKTLEKGHNICFQHSHAINLKCQITVVYATPSWNIFIQTLVMSACLMKGCASETLFKYN